MQGKIRLVSIAQTDSGVCAELGVALRPFDCWDRGFESR
jgi:hypothetical protein